jgi:PAS domain S-box-containing protein
MTRPSRPSPQSPPEILLVSADLDYATWLESQLRDDDGLSVTRADSAAAAFADGTLAEAFDGIVADGSLAAPDVIAFLETVRAQRPELPFVLLTGAEEEALLSDAISAGVTEHLPKVRRPATADRLRTVLEGSIASVRHRDELRRREQHARAVLDTAPDAMVVVQDGAVEYANGATADVFAYAAPEQLQGRAIDDVLVPVDGDRSEPIGPLLDPDSNGESILRRSLRLRRHDDIPIAVTVSATRIPWNGGDACLLVIRDDTERAALREELLRKNRAIDSAPIGITIAEPTADGDNSLIYLNDAFERVTGYTEAEALGRDCRFLQGEETDPETVAEIRTAIGEDRPTTVEILNYRADGTPFWNRLTVAPIEMDDGVYYVGFQEDITDQMEKRQDLRRFRRAAEAAGHAFFITDTDGTITHVNPAFEEITGYSKEEAIGSTPRLLQSGQQDDDYYERLWETILDGETWEAEIVDERSSGEFYYAYQTISPLVSDDGEVEEFVALQTDITERRERERQLKTLDRVLRHNLRNELTLIKGHAEMIRSADGPTAAESADAIVTTAERLLESAEKGREISELLASPSPPESTDIVAVLTRIVAELRGEYPHAEITAEFPASASVEAADRIEEALAELIENAIVHNDSPSPSVHVRVDAEREDDADTVTVSVVDDGPGIPEMERAVLTDVQLEEDDLFHSSGLGLWFVYWTVQRSRGRLGVEENEPEGSRVVVELPSAGTDLVEE